jgi:uncharacterized membrane protein YccF (DUF307 family)
LNPPRQEQKMQSQPVIVARNDGANLLVRAIYFVLIGWWLSGIWAAIAWLLSVSIIGLPVGLYMLNRLPQVVTLKPSAQTLLVTPSGQVVRYEVPQRPFLVRAIYFLLIGWWLSALWIIAAWALHASIIGMVLGFWMFNRVPAVITLAR